MSKFIDIKVDTNLIRRIDGSRLSQSERELAVSALRNAEQLVDACLWVGRKIEQLGARLFLKPSLRH